MHYIQLLLIGAFFGSSAMCFKILSAQISIFTAVFVRLFIGSIFLIAFCLVKKHKIFIKNQLWKTVLFGLVNFAIPLSLFCYAGKFLDSSIVAILNAMFPVFTIIFASILLKEQVSKFGWFGVFLSICGIIVLNMKEGLKFNIADILPAFAVIFATICYAVCAIFVRTKCKEIPAITNVTGGILIAMISMLPFVFFESNFSAFQMPKIVLVAVYMGIFSTAIAYLLQFSLVKTRGVVFSANSAFLIPIFGTIYGVTFMGEIFTPQRIIGSVMILLGLAFILKMNHHIEALTKKFKQKYKLKKL